LHPRDLLGMSITFDEFGRPLLIFKDQESKKRLTGLEVQKVERPKLSKLPYG
jgi:hypothetical protein